jgi:hypothetical protein
MVSKKCKIENFNKEYLQYLFPQRTRLETEYSIEESSSQEEIDTALSKMVETDYQMIEEFLPEICENSLDIGCGLSLIDIAIYKHYPDNYYPESRIIDIHLLDKTELNTTKISGFNEEYRGYNSMDAARKTLSSNGVPDEKIHSFEVGNHSELYNKKFNLITSFLSCGWHFDVDTYIDLFEKTLCHDGCIIIDIRHNTGQVEKMKSKFKLVKQIYNHAESKHTGGNIGDRYVFKFK